MILGFNLKCALNLLLFPFKGKGGVGEGGGITEEEEGRAPGREV